MSATAFDPGPIAAVDGHDSDNGWTLVFVRDFAHPPQQVWNLLTDPDRLRAWAPYTADRDLGSVGTATLTMIDEDAPEDLQATVIRAESPSVLEYDEGDQRLRWELTETGAGTRLTLRHTMESSEWASRMAAGWHLCLLVAEHLLAGQPIAPIRGAAAKDYGWEDLRRAYAEKLASTGAA